MVIFPTNASSMLKKLQLCISFVTIGENNVYVTYCFINGGNHVYNFQEVFRWFFLIYTDFAHKISHIKPSKYDSTFGTKIAICLKKVGGDEAVDRNKNI